MSVYDYEKFLDKYDSDKAIKKFVDLRRKEKEKEIFRKIGLDEYFQPVTSVIKQELKPFHKLINQQQIRDRDRDDGGWEDRQTERDRLDDGADIINIDDEKSLNDLDTIVDDEETDYDDIENENKKIKDTEIEQPSLDNPYDELKKSKFNKKTKEFADEWLKISKEELGYVKGQTNFNSFTRDDLTKYRENLKQMQTSSSKRISNKCIQQYDNDIKNQIKLINDKIGKPINPRQKEIEEEKKYQKDVEENKKINQMFKQTKKKEGKGVKRGNNNNNGSSLIYYNNPQQLIDRLRLLVGSKRAGNTNPEIDSEIIGISDELVKKGLINNGEYIRFMNKNFIIY